MQYQTNSDSQFGDFNQYQTNQEFQNPAQTNDDDDFTEEERQLMAQAEAVKQARMQSVYEFQQQEASLKQERRAAGAKALADWVEERGRQINQRVKTNKEEQEVKLSETDRMHTSMNPWEKIVDNCDFTNSASQTRDVSRMKQVIVSRKADLAKNSTR